MTHHDESTAQTSRFATCDTTRGFSPGYDVPAETLGSILRRTTGRDYTPAGRGYIGSHRKEELS